MVVRWRSRFCQVDPAATERSRSRVSCWYVAANGGILVWYWVSFRRWLRMDSTTAEELLACSASFEEHWRRGSGISQVISDADYESCHAVHGV